MRAFLFPVLVWLALTPVALALDSEEMFADPAKEARAREIGRQLRCLVCQNQSIFDSNAGLAKDLRVAVRERMDEGDSDKEVLDYLATRFGDYVLLKPRVSAATSVLWIAPFFFVLLGGVGMIAYHRNRRAAPQPQTMTEADRAEARRVLNRE